MLTKQGDVGDELYLVLDGVVSVDVDGNALAELGPGAVARGAGAARGRPAYLHASPRVTAARRGRRAATSIDLDKLRTLAESHHREDLVEVDD